MSVGLEQYSLINRVFGISITEQMDLDVLTFSLLLKDAFCQELSKTESGREYLNDCWRLNLTEPDVNTLREQF